MSNGVPGCCCFGGNTPELARFCCCQQRGDEGHHKRVVAAMQLYLDLANEVYYTSDDPDAELEAMTLCGEADRVGWATP